MFCEGFDIVAKSRMLIKLAKVIKANSTRAKYLQKIHRCEYGKITDTGEAANDNGTNQIG